MSRHIKLILLAALAAVAWYALLSRGKPVPKGSYVDREHDFSLMPMPHWLMLTPQTWRETLKARKVYLAEPIQKGLARGQIAVSLIRQAKPGGISPSIHVWILPQSFPRLNKGDMERLAGVMDEQLLGSLGEHEHESMRLVEVDGIRSLLVTGRAHTEILGRRVDIRMAHALVRGSRKTYLLTLDCPLEESAACQDDFQRLMDSFRVLKRPSLF